MQYLILVEADRKYIKGEEYFKYEKIKFYVAYPFENFLQLIKNDKIRITFKIGVFKSGIRKGQIHDHRTGFSIAKENLNLLYFEI